jgi:RHS repeat-associated protein
VGTNVDLFSYDSTNRVVARQVNGTKTYLVYDGVDLIEERDSSGNVLATYVHGVAPDELLSKTTSTGVVYYHHNGLGSVTDLTSATGAVVEKYKYDIYGKAAITSGTGATLTASAYGNRFMFTGREFLAGVNLYDYHNRVYSADLGRFLQTDPLRLDGGDVNIYRYAGNDPINSTVPLGSYGNGYANAYYPTVAYYSGAFYNGIYDSVYSRVPLSSGVGVTTAGQIQSGKAPVGFILSQNLSVGVGVQPDDLPPDDDDNSGDDSNACPDPGAGS